MFALLIEITHTNDTTKQFPPIPFGFGNVTLILWKIEFNLSKRELRKLDIPADVQ